MLALALQQEDASAASPTQPSLAGDEAVAMALLREDRALLGQQRIRGGDDYTTLVNGRQGAPVREDRDRFVPPVTRFACLPPRAFTRRMTACCVPTMHPAP